MQPDEFFVVLNNRYVLVTNDLKQRKKISTFLDKDDQLF